MSTHPIILGGGPAGLAAAHELTRAGEKALVVDRDESPGGLCRTVEFKGFLFDVGGHRFLTKYPEIQQLWLDVMHDDMLHVRRMSRIYYRNRYFKYPLSAANAFANLGPAEVARCVASFVKYRLRPIESRSFEGWMCNRFGRRLFEIFFKTYTEKLWGIPCKTLSSDWADQRIENLSLGKAVRQALLGRAVSGPKTLTEEFLYPKTGPGEFYRRFQDQIVRSGAEIRHSTEVVRVRHDGRRVTSVVTKAVGSNVEEEREASAVFSSIALPRLVAMMDPAPPEPVLEAARQLKYRNYLVVNAIMNRENLFPDQWVYVQSPEVRLARLQNYKNWSPHMVPDPKKTSLGLEYFASTEESFWQLPDSELIAWALSDLEKVGLGSPADMLDAFVIRQRDAYPIYSQGYRQRLDEVRSWLATLPNLFPVGRAGLFRYCNSDLALLLGYYAARNFLGTAKHDLWNVG